MKKLRLRFLVVFMVGFIYLGIEPLQASQFDKIAVACAAFGTSILLKATQDLFFLDKHRQENNIDVTQCPEFAKFVKKYRCSREIERQVHEHKDNKTAVLYHSSIQQYRSIPFYNKGNNIERIINAERTKKIIATHQLDSIGVPDKCLCHMYGNVWNVIARTVEKSDDPLKISLKEAQQLKKIADEISYSDFHRGNIVRGDQGKLMIIDTEDQSYFRDYKNYMLYEFLKDLKPEQDVIQWIEKVSEHVVKYNGDRYSGDFIVDFEKAKEEYIQYYLSS